MSTRYFLTCNDCELSISVADRSFRGTALTPEAKEKLANFTINHCSHSIDIISEYEYFNKRNKKGNIG